MDALFLTNSKTYIYGQVQVLRDGVDIQLFYKDGAKKKVGEI